MKVDRQTFSLKEVATLLGCHSETVRRAIKRGDLKASKMGPRYRISKADLSEYYRGNGGGELFSE